MSWLRLELLKDKRKYYRLRAARVLGHIGPDAKTAVPALNTLLEDKDKEIREAAHEALKKVAPTP